VSITVGGAVMKEVVERLEYLIEKLPVKVRVISEEQMATRLTNMWSKKEILGHLCDSATNNHHRFIKVQFEKQPFVITPYAQNNWVEIQDYQSMSVDEVVSYWTSLNKHIVKVVSRTPIDKIAYLCETGENQTITLSELILDYLRHLEHHIMQIFGTADF
jgi:hypothetical protein